MQQTPPTFDLRAISKNAIEFAQLGFLSRLMSTAVMLSEINQRDLISQKVWKPKNPSLTLIFIKNNLSAGDNQFVPIK